MKILALILGVFLSYYSFAQATSSSNKIANGLTQNEIASLSADELNRIEFFANKGFTVHQNGKENESYPLLSATKKTGLASIDYSAITQTNFNPLLFNFPSRESHLFYRIDGTDMVVQIFSDGYCDMRFEQYETNAKNHKK